MNVLFVCEDNCALSIMAESILRAVAANRFGAYSAGCASRNAIDPQVLEFLADHHMPIEGLHAKTVRDFRDCRLRFRWRSEGVKPLDAVNGPVLTIEGRDAAGSPRAWYVRLWNYAEGTAEDAAVSIDFATVQGGSFQTWIQTSHTGRQLFRVYDPQADRASKPVAVTVG